VSGLVQNFSRYSPFATAALLAALALPTPRVAAQSIGERPPLSVETSQYDRLDFPDEQVGIRAGLFQLYPSAAVSMAYDSNLFATAQARDEEALSVSEALLHLENQSGQTRFEGETFARARRFLDAADQNTTEYGASASIDTDLTARDGLSGRLLAQRRFESRIEIETPNSRQVSFYKESRGDLSHLHTFNRFSLRSSIGGRRVDYEEGSQRFRDRYSYSGALRGAYLLRNGISLLGTAYYRQDQYRFVTPSIPSAQTNGYQLGARMEIPDLLEFELSSGVFQRDFGQNSGSTSGVSIRGGVTWYPTRLTTLRADILREDAPTRIVGAFGKIRTNASLEITHEYSRRLNFYARGRMIVDDFNTIQRTDKTYLTQLGAVCLLSRMYVVAAEYDYATRNSASVGDTFVRHVTSLSLLARF
jgi:hypothetical protein